MRPLVRPHQPVCELQQHTLSYTGRSQQDSCLPNSDSKRNVLEDRFAIEADGDIVEDDYRLTFACGGFVEERKAASP